VTPDQPATGADGDTRPAEQPRTKFTSRAAVLVVVVCAVTLSLAYPVREYVAERREMDALEASNAQIAAQVRQLEAQQRELASPTYIEQLARDKLHMCFPTQTCYEVIVPGRRTGTTGVAPATSPWYELLWKSVREADKATAR
jgi:cell division protein FtsB